MMDIIIVAAIVGGLWWAGSEAVKGVKVVTHKVEAGIHHVLYPHEKAPK